MAFACRNKTEHANVSDLQVSVKIRPVSLRSISHTWMLGNGDSRSCKAGSPPPTAVGLLLIRLLSL